MSAVTRDIADLTKDIPGLEILQAGKYPITGLVLDSRKVTSGDLFFAIKGTVSDGHKFIQKAIDKGAVAIAVENVPDNIPGDIAILRTNNVPEIMAAIAKKFFDNPANKLNLIGITGTNGKTSIARLLYNTWRQMGFKAGVITTIDTRIGERVIPSKLTTPDLLTLYTWLYEMVEKRTEYVAMEVSSHAIQQGRVMGIPFTGAIFTNISHDHLDYHGDMKSYIDAKKGLFDQLPSAAFALVNIDDSRGKIMVQNTPASVSTYALQREADFKGKVISMDLSGMELQFDSHRFMTRLTAQFNAYNLLACYGACTLLGLDREEVLKAISAAPPAEGRFEIVHSKERSIKGIVDYAHTPDALAKTLESIQKLKAKGKILTVFGCGGDRDKTKRPKMGQIAAMLSDSVILTSDNPRTESPAAILDEIAEGIPRELKKKVLRIEDRREAIRTAWMLAEEGDVILLAGKGHERYQIIGEERIPFDDKEILESLMNASDKIIE